MSVWLWLPRFAVTSTCGYLDLRLPRLVVTSFCGYLILRLPHFAVTLSCGLFQRIIMMKQKQMIITNNTRPKHLTKCIIQMRWSCLYWYAIYNFNKSLISSPTNLHQTNIKQSHPPLKPVNFWSKKHSFVLFNITWPQKSTIERIHSSWIKTHNKTLMISDYLSWFTTNLLTSKDQTTWKKLFIDP